jgi:hypothetical protein
MERGAGADDAGNFSHRLKRLDEDKVRAIASLGVPADKTALMCDTVPEAYVAAKADEVRSMDARSSQQRVCSNLILVHRILVGNYK